MAEPEWPASLDVQRLLENGWRPTPFHEFVVKIHSRCNLACDYCYMYEMADQSWRAQPRRMARRTVDRVAARIAEHARANLLSRVAVVLHGGEPLLAGADHLRHAMNAIRTAAAPDVEVDFSVQTNGVLLDPVFLTMFEEFEVAVGVSLDGDEQGHDRHRRRSDGQGSYRAVAAGLAHLTSSAYRHLFSGLLTAIDLRNDPVGTYEALLAFDPPGVDFLLPLGNWDSPPPGRAPDITTPYGDWLIAIFDRWYGAKIQETRIRLFSEIISLLLGGGSGSESVGLAPVAMAVVETNGRIEQVDTLKAAYAGATATVLHVSRDPLDAALLLPAFAARQIGLRALADECQVCPIQDICGGGLYAHRYRPGSGFRNPSVYCQDLFRLITHIQRRVTGDLETMRAGLAP